MVVEKLLESSGPDLRLSTAGSTVEYSEWLSASHGDRRPPGTEARPHPHSIGQNSQELSDLGTGKVLQQRVG